MGGMHEYRVTVEENGAQRELTLFAATAAAAREQAEALTTGEVSAVRFVRAAGVSCAIRDGRPRR